MENQNFTLSIEVDQTPKEAFDAIKNVRGWWSEEITGVTDELNEEFYYHYKDLHSCNMKLVQRIPNQKLTWLVTENHFNFVNDQTEWINTKVNFDITQKNGKTLIKFTHEGLIPGHECYDICSTAWTDYIKGSLYNLITTGKGQPNLMEAA